MRDAAASGMTDLQHQQTGRLPRRRRTQEERSSATRRALMEAARKTICERGYARATMDEIARRAGVSRGAQTHHYPNKQLLVLAVADHIFVNVETEVAGIAGRLQSSGGNFEAFIAELWQTAFSRRNFSIILELVTASRTDPVLKEKLHERWMQLTRTYDDIWRRTLRRADGFSKETETALSLTLSLLRGMSYERIMHDEEPERYRELLTYWADLLRARLREETR